MSPVHSRRLVTTGSLTLALALATPLAAFADTGADRAPAAPAAGDAGSQRSTGPSNQAAPAADQGQQQPERGRSDDAPAGEQPAAPKGEGTPARAGSGSGEGKPARAGSGSGEGKPASAGSGSGERAAAAERTQRKRDRGPAKAAPRKTTPAPATQQPVAPQGQGEGRQDADPAGNNGTIKIDGVEFDSGRGNEPHVGCVFQLDFYGFDAGDTASITFTGQAPTRTEPRVLHTETTTISHDAAGGGQDRDQTLTFSVDDELSELLDVAPHPKQGWHVKVAVDVDDAPGGAKQKVFWISCDTDEAPAGQTPNNPSGQTPKTPEPPNPTTPEKSAPQTPEEKVPTPKPQTPATPEREVDEVDEVDEVVLPVDGVEAPAQPGEDVDGDLPTGISGETEAPATGGTGVPADVVAPQAPVVPAGEQTVVAQSAVSGTTVQAATGAAAVERSAVSARGAATPAMLPFTGVRDLAALLAVGVGALGLGGLANRLGRRQALAKHAMR